ncbi:recombinase family protein [Roseburia hominis]
MEYGYVRVSTDKQNVERQIASMEQAGVKPENIYIDRYTGASFDRPEYRKILNKLKKDDVMFVDDLFRFGRDYEEIKKNWEYINKELKVDIVVIDMPILDTRQYKDLVGTLISDIVLSLLSYCAQHSRENMLREQANGIKKAKERGVVFGRPRKITMEEFGIEYQRVLTGTATVQELSDEMDISKTTYYRYLKKLQELKNS